MGVEEIGIGAAALAEIIARVVIWADITEQSPVHPVSVLPVPQAGIEIDPPAAAPAGRLESLDFQCLGASLPQILALYRGTGIQAYQMGLVPVLRIRVRPVVIPLLECTVRPDLIRAQAGKFVFRIGDEFRIHAQFFRGGDRIRHAFPDQGQVRRAAIQGDRLVAVGCKEGILRRGRRRSEQFAVLLDQPVQAEHGRTLQDGIIALQGGPVTVEEPMLPEVRGEPDTAHGPVRPAGVARAFADRRRHGPDVTVVAATPTALHPVEVAGGRHAVLAEMVHELRQDLVHFGKARDFRGPVILLQVDVHRVVAAPRRQDLFVPKSLQVGGHAGRPGAGNQQVAPELEIERLELRIDIQAVGVALELRIRRQGGDGRIGASEVQADAVEILLVISHVRLPEDGVRFGGSLVHHAPGLRNIVAAFRRRILERAVETRGVGDQDQHLAAAAQEQGFAVAGHVPAHRNRLEQGAEVDAARGIVEEGLDPFRMIVAGKGMVGRIAAQVKFPVRRRDLARQRAFQHDAGVDPRLVPQAQDDDGIGRRHEAVALLRAPLPGKAHGSRRI